MKIAIIGGGVAGLSTAWLLDPDDEVVLFEKNDYLGGCARTISVERGNGSTNVDLAAQYISASMYPLFLGLLRLLGVRCRSSPSTVTLHSTPRARSIRLTPTGAVPALDEIVAMLRIGRAIGGASMLEQRGDWSLTVDEYAEQLRMTETFRREVFYPFVAMFCGPSLSVSGGISARAALQYPFLNRPTNPLLPFGMLEVEGGMGSYIPHLLRRITRATMRISTPVHAIRRENRGFAVESDIGTERFDQIVLAVPARAAVPLLRGLPGAESLRVALNKVEYIETTSHIHSDANLMPPDRSYWSSTNQMVRESSCSLTMWLGRQRRDNFFKTLALSTSPQPRTSFADETYHHPLMTPGYFAVQDKVHSLQGVGGVWVAGAYTIGFECHESGLASAVRIVRRLRPNSANLRRLLEAQVRQPRPRLLRSLSAYGLHRLRRSSSTGRSGL